MKAFAELYAALDQTTKTNAKVDALKRYLSAAQPEDAAWAVNFLIGRRPKRLLESRKLAQWAIEEAGVPDWLFGDCYHAVGDFAETIALLLPPADASSQLPLHYWIEERLLPLRVADDETRRRPLCEHFSGKRPEPAEVDAQQSQNSAKLNQNSKGFTESIIAPAKQMLHQQQVPGR